MTAAAGSPSEPVVRAALRELGAPGTDLVESMARLSSLADQLADDADAEAAGDVAAIRMLAELADEYRRATAGTDGLGFRSWLVANRDEAEGGDGVERPDVPRRQGPRVARVHVVGVEDGLVPLARATTTEAEAEERRLFYVAVTRAARRPEPVVGVDAPLRRRQAEHTSSLSVPRRARPGAA